MSEDSFLREIEEELRSDKLKAFWRRFAPFIIGGAVLIVLLVAANEVLKWWNADSAANASDQYYAAATLAESGDIEGALAAYAALEQDGPSGYVALARFQQAAVLGQQGDFDGAIAAYDELAASLDQQRLRDLAYVFAGYLAVDHLDAAAVEQRVGGLMGEENPMRNNAREALGLAQYKAGDIDGARANFEAIAADPAAGQNMQMRAFVYLEQLASTGVDVSEQLMEATDPEIVEPEMIDPSADLETLGQPIAPVTE